MELKNKIKKVLLSVICAAMLISVIFLGTIAAVYAAGEGTPNIFGNIVYLVKTDAFELTDGTALLARQVPYSEIQPGNLIIFSLDDNRHALAKIQTAELSDGVYSFTALTENGEVIPLSQSRVTAKSVGYSKFWGTIISFASSPLGVLVIAVLPCAVLIIIELVKFAVKSPDDLEDEEEELAQLEVPAYSPHRRRTDAKSPHEDDSVPEDSVGLYDAQVRRNPNIERTDVLEIPAQETPLFLGPKRRQIAVPKQRIQEPSAPASRNKTDGEKPADAAYKPKVSSRTDLPSEVSRSAKAAKPKSAEEELVKPYSPGKSAHTASSLPRLDALLSDDNSDESYDIDDILSELGKGRGSNSSSKRY